MADAPIVNELISSVRGNVDVARDAMKGPANEDSHHIVSDLMLEIKQAQEALQKKASEMVESGRFENTNEIFETIDMVGQLEPEFADWSKGVSTGGDNIGASIHIEPSPEEVTDKTKKKKKKKKRKDSGGEPVDTIGETGGWEAFPVPVQTSSGNMWAQQPSTSVTFAPAPAVIPRRSPTTSQTVPEPAPQSSSGVLTLGMQWDTIGPLLGDPGSSEDARKQRLGDLIKEAIASECGITLDRIRIKSVS
jgi:hypothetical protein